MSSQVKLKEPPNDGISAVSFVPNESNLLLVTSWDSVGCHSPIYTVLREH
jgi:hypothetical protein